MNILLIKETKALEKRVALVPDDVEKLTEQNRLVFVESGAGNGINMSDEAYMKSGAMIRNSPKDDDVNGFINLFENIDVIVRAKRANPIRENTENKVLPEGIIMIGALDPGEKGSAHLKAYKDRKILAYSIDQINLPYDDPMNILSSMSKFAGSLALEDAINKSSNKDKIANVMIIGFGAAGKSAFSAAVKKGYKVSVTVSRDEVAKQVKDQGGHSVLISRELSIELQKQTLANSGLYDSDIVITSARQSNQAAPVLIDKLMLSRMKAGCVIVDLALSEGGNVEGSEHDATIVTDSGVLITNVSGYPKVAPVEASKVWSLASRLWIESLIKNPELFLEALIK